VKKKSSRTVCMCVSAVQTATTNTKGASEMRAVTTPSKETTVVIISQPNLSIREVLRTCGSATGQWKRCHSTNKLYKKL